MLGTRIKPFHKTVAGKKEKRKRGLGAGNEYVSTHYGFIPETCRFFTKPIMF